MKTKRINPVWGWFYNYKGITCLPETCHREKMSDIKCTVIPSSDYRAMKEEIRHLRIQAKKDKSNLRWYDLNCTCL